MFFPPPSPDPPVPLSPSQETTLYGCTVHISEPVGVIGIACPDESPLLAFVKGNTTVIIPSEKYPLSATDLYQVNWREGWAKGWGVRGRKGRGWKKKGLSPLILQLSLIH